jgi:hypothetical protein
MGLRTRDAVVNTLAMHMGALLLRGRNTTMHGRIGAAVDGRAAAQWRPHSSALPCWRWWWFSSTTTVGDGGGGSLAAPPPWVMVVVVA